MTNDRQSILLIGASGSGKTHYGIQLLGRMQHCSDSALTTDGSVEDLTLFAEGLRALEGGRSAEHTASKTHDTLKLSLRTRRGVQTQLLWPEYAGEQIRDILNTRKVNAPWLARLQESSRWMLFIRPTQLRPIGRDLKDIIVRLESNPESKPSVAKDDTPPWQLWDDNAKLVELLQILLHSSRHFSLNRLHVPRLAVVISCWDELSEEQQSHRPAEILGQFLPLVSRFVEANWESDSRSVWGLSALGRALHKDSQDEEFALNGPETAGHVINPAGEKNIDLTLPVHWLMDGAV